MKQTEFKKAWLKVSQDLLELSERLRALSNNVAELNYQALMVEQPTMNLQLVMPEIRDSLDLLTSQLHCIRLDAEDDPETQRVKSPVFRDDLVARAISGLEAMIELSHTMSKVSGWWDKGTDDPLIFPTKIALMHSELSEALEADRKDKVDDHLPHLSGVSVEFADLLHRVFDLCGAFGISLSRAYVEKGLYNLERADHKPANRALKGGKRY